MDYELLLYVILAISIFLSTLSTLLVIYMIRYMFNFIQLISQLLDITNSVDNERYR